MLAGDRTSDCLIGERTYRIVPPCANDHPAFVGAFAHSYRGSAEATTANETLVGLADALEVAADAVSLDWRTPACLAFRAPAAWPRSPLSTRYAAI